MLLSARSLVHTSQLSFCLLLPCWPEEKHTELKWDSTRNSEYQHPTVASPSGSQHTGFCFIFNYFSTMVDKAQSFNYNTGESQGTQHCDEEFLRLHQTYHSDNSIFTSQRSTSPCFKRWNTEEPQLAPLGALQARAEPQGAGPGAPSRHTPASRTGGPH